MLGNVTSACFVFRRNSNRNNFQAMESNSEKFARFVLERDATFDFGEIDQSVIPQVDSPL